MNKLILAILQGDDYNEVIKTLNERGFSVTVLNSSGGFLKKRSYTIMIGLPEEKLDEALSILEKKAGRRTETIYQSSVMTAGPVLGAAPTIPLNVPCGGVTVFVLDMNRMERY
ncbi:MAG: cyclic-di-AMP receptor [Clostridia bacterium]|nr:cyclic-di-AMP receptor [Clostridia bacterium]